MRTPRRALPGPTQNSSIDKPRPSLVNHQSRCTICKHRQREMIETAFLQWRSLTEIETEFKLTSRSTIYDHAHAFNLFERRARNLGFALDYFIQESEAIRLNARCVLQAIKMRSQIDDNGKWVRPAVRVELQTQHPSTPTDLELLDVTPSRLVAAPDDLDAEELSPVEKSAVSLGTLAGRESS